MNRTMLVNKTDIPALYYPVLIAVYMLTLLSYSVFRPGAAAAVLAVLTWIWLFLSGLLPKLKDFNVPDKIMSIWLLYNLASAVWAGVFGMPPSVYIGEFFTAVLPMVFYYIAAYSGERSIRRFYVLFAAAVLILGVFSIILYLSAPGFYIDFCFEHGLISKADVQTLRVRMVSVTGSTVLGYLGVALMPVSLRILVDSGKKQWLLGFAGGCLIAFMSNQRASMSAAILVIVYFNIVLFLVYKKLDKKYLFVEIGIIIAGVVALFVAANGIFMKVFYRLISLPLAIGERSDQWVGAANNMVSIWTGNGLGANGHRAIGYAEHVIADGGLAKLYCETGIVGLSLFVFLMLLCLKRGFKNIRRFAPEVCIVLMTLVISIGSNTLSFALSVPVFYYALGRLSSAERGTGGKE